MESNKRKEKKGILCEKKEVYQLKLQEYRNIIQKINFASCKMKIGKAYAYSCLTLSSIIFLLSLKDFIPGKNISSYQKELKALEEEKKDKDFYHYVSSDYKSYNVEHVSDWYSIGEHGEFARLHYFVNPMDSEDNLECLEIGRQETQEITVIESVPVEEIKKQVQTFNKKFIHRKYYSLWMILCLVYLHYLKIYSEPEMEERKEMLKKLKKELETENFKIDR